MYVYWLKRAVWRIECIMCALQINSTGWIARSSPEAQRSLWGNKHWMPRLLRPLKILVRRSKLPYILHSPFPPSISPSTCISIPYYNLVSSFGPFYLLFISVLPPLPSTTPPHSSPHHSLLQMMQRTRKKSTALTKYRPSPLRLNFDFYPTSNRKFISIIFVTSHSL